MFKATVAMQGGVVGLITIGIGLGCAVVDDTPGTIGGLLEVVEMPGPAGVPLGTELIVVVRTPGTPGPGTPGPGTPGLGTPGLGTPGPGPPIIKC